MRALRLMALCAAILASAWAWQRHHAHAVAEATVQASAAPLLLSASAEPVPRAFYGRRLEPHDSVVLHGAGQSDRQSFDGYSKALAPARPLLMMRYVDLHDDLPTFFAQLRADLHDSRDFLIPQIGLSLNAGSGAHHYEAATAQGKDDTAIRQVCEGLESLDRPVYLRPGYEFNGPWNEYIASSYVAAFRHIATRVHACLPRTVAIVWDWSPDADLDRQRAGAPPQFAAARWQQFYPGDEFVDWWGLNLFSPESVSSASTAQFLKEAEKRRFPVMIAESTLRGASIHQPRAAIDGWFAPYFGLIRSTKGIKAFCYIDWDWRMYPQWADWGDARIESEPQVLDYYRQQVVGGSWIAGGRDRSATLKLLNALAQ